MTFDDDRPIKMEMPDNEKVHWVSFDSDRLDDFYYWKLIIEKNEPVKTKLSEFFKKIGMLSTTYIDGKTGSCISFGISKIATHTIVFYNENGAKEDSVEKFKAAMKSIHYNTSNRDVINIIDINDILGRDLIYRDGKIVWLK